MLPKRADKTDQCIVKIHRGGFWMNEVVDVVGFVSQVEAKKQGAKRQ
jgi:hypothetical protein